MGSSKKYYVVWVGRNPGIYDSWGDCQEQIDHYPGARFKGYASIQEAQEAFSHPIPTRREGSQRANRDSSWTKGEGLHGNSPTPLLRGGRTVAARPSGVALTVDGACNMRTGVMEYRCVSLVDGRELFHRGPFQDTTNNVGEFLALVEAIALCNTPSNVERWGRVPIYSDSKTALSWVRDRQARTKMPLTPANEILHRLIARALAWLQSHSYANPVLKWETAHWGEIPADFGRK